MAPNPSRASRQLRSARNWSRVLGLAGTLLLHGFVFESLILGSSNHKSRPLEVQGAGALHVDAVTAPVEELVLVTVPNIRKDDSDLAEQIASLGPQLQHLSISILSANPLRAADLETTDQAPKKSAQAPPDEGDPALHALMFGRYTGQINARIERAWRRPRSPVNGQTQMPIGSAETDIAAGDDTFNCRVQIRQDNRGNVQEVLVTKCNGTEAWQHSLVTAINEASPLPAPPIPSVFTQALNMTFEAHAYQPGSAPDEYELEPRESERSLADSHSTAGQPILDPTIHNN